jgi:hypothetical protein
MIGLHVVVPLSAMSTSLFLPSCIVGVDAASRPAHLLCGLLSHLLVSFTGGAGT